MNKKIKLQCPGTVANLVCGFDVLGLCLNEPFDVMEMGLNYSGRINLHCTNFPLPSNPAKNTAGIALQAMLATLGKNIGFDISITKNILPGSGLGSSAASAAGAVAGANHLLGNPFSRNELVAFAMEGELAASGAKHADNVAPCLLGGVTVVQNNEPLRVCNILAPKLWVSVVRPAVEVLTSEARKILPKEISLKAATQQWANVAGLIAGFVNDDAEMITASLNDGIIEPARKKLIPMFDEIKNSSMKVGALGGGISGSGPAIFMLSRSESTAQNIATEMKRIYDSIGMSANYYVTTINQQGVQIFE